ncbi:MAG: 50S ribosomal protein L22 [bacterium]
MEIKAILRNYRKSARKVKPIIDLIRGRSVLDAETQLTFVKQESAPVVLKLLKSAVANAVNNNKLDPANLFVKAVMANQGPTIKRFDPRAQGRAFMLRKRTSHLEIVLGEKVPTQEIKKSKNQEIKGSEAKQEGEEARKQETKIAKKPAAKKTTK